MVDLHCHILPGVDDGPATLDIALQMAEFCVADGIEHIIATPHCHRFIHLLRADILPKVAEFNHILAQRRIPLTVLPGSEIQVTNALEFEREFEAGLYCHLGDRPAFTLIEFNWSFEQFPADAPALLRWIQAHGLVPILAHPERYEFFWTEQDLLKALVDTGAWIQITVDSLLGNHGPGPKAFGRKFLEEYPLAVLATDAHNLARCSGLKRGYEWVRAEFGRERETDLLDRAQSVLAASYSQPGLSAS